MEDLNNPESEIYKKTLETQKLYISERLKIIKNRYLDDGCNLADSVERIAKHLNRGHAQNLVHTFFNFNAKKCVVCKGKKGVNGIRQLERAHCNILSNPRYDLLIMAINDLWVDAITPIKSEDILKLFIQKHEICPIYMLCNICHNKYDN